MLSILDWILFHIIIIIMLAVDLGIFQRKAHAPSLKEAAAWSVTWIIVAVLFNILIYLQLGHDYGLEFTTAYVIEKSLSVDNLFVFAVVFHYFGVSLTYQHKVLFFGIIGAIVTRALFILGGIALLENFKFMIYVFGVVLIYSGFRLLRRGEKATEPEKNPLVKWVKKIIPLTDKLHGDRFFVVNNGHRVATPLLLTLVAIESTDILFALDSIPAVLAVTTNFFIAYTSNIFAILGLRALYFLIIQALLRLRYIHVGLSILLTYLGIKMIFSEILHIPLTLSLAVVLSIITISTLASLMAKKGKTEDTSFF